MWGCFTCCQRTYPMTSSSGSWHACNRVGILRYLLDVIYSKIEKWSYPDNQKNIDAFYWSLLEKAMAPHSSTLAWKIPWTEEPGRLQTMGSRRVGHDWATSLSLFTFIGEGNGNPLQCSCLENPRDGGAWWAAVYGVTQSRTRLKRLSSSIDLYIAGQMGTLDTRDIKWH